jgi:hypothetical protein
MRRIKYKELVTSPKYEITESGILTLVGMTKHVKSIVVSNKSIYKRDVYYLILTERFKWDGPSGPTIDSKEGMIASAAHDMLYKMLRDEEFGKISEKDQSIMRKWADKQFLHQLKLSGMGWFRRRMWYRGVRIGGESSASPETKKNHEEIFQAE